MNSTRYLSILEGKLKDHSGENNKKMFTDNSVVVLDWPGSSPDLNPIEQLSKNHCSNISELQSAIKWFWCSQITSELRQAFVKSCQRE